MKKFLDQIDFASLPVDLILFSYGIYQLFAGSDVFTLPVYSTNEVAIMLIASLTVLPWYIGYLLLHFENYPNTIKRLIQWLFGLGMLSLIVFLFVTFIPEVEFMDEQAGFTAFLGAFGMFFTVLGPLMIIAGYADASFLDDNEDLSKPINWPMVTWSMFMIIGAVSLLILTVGLFQPEQGSWAAIGVILLGFFGGPLVSVLIFGGIGYFFTQIAKGDKNRLLIKGIRFILPLLVINCLIWWNDITLAKIHEWNNFEPLSIMGIIWSMILCGILPYRIIMLLKPPVNWYYFISGIIALSIYIIGLNQAMQ